MWAFADQGSYKMALRRIYKKWDKAKTRAEELKLLINENFSDEKLYEGFCANFIDKFDDSNWWDEEEVIEYE